MRPVSLFSSSSWSLYCSTSGTGIREPRLHGAVGRLGAGKEALQLQVRRRPRRECPRSPPRPTPRVARPCARSPRTWRARACRRRRSRARRDRPCTRPPGRRRRSRLRSACAPRARQVARRRDPGHLAPVARRVVQEVAPVLVVDADLFVLASCALAALVAATQATPRPMQHHVVAHQQHHFVDVREVEGDRGAALRHLARGLKERAAILELRHDHRDRRLGVDARA